MNVKLSLAAIISTGFLFSCASESEKINLIHIHEASDFADQKSVFYSNDNLNQAEINRMMKAKIKIPEKVKIAVIRLEPKSDTEDYQFYRKEKNLAAVAERDPMGSLIDYLQEQEMLRSRLVAAVQVPESLVPPKADVKWIRNLGVTMQADLVLVVDSRNDKFQDRQVIKNGVAMSVSSADTYLIDTRSGVILNTNSYTREAFAEKHDKDFDLYQTLDRARAASERKIYKKLAGDVKELLENLK